jgi:hypothetical protein
VIQTGKLLLRSGEIAENREHSLTSRSHGCPSALDQVAAIEWWLSSVSYPTEVIPDGVGASILASRPIRDRSNRDWVLFASITKPLERGKGGRPHLRSRILAIPEKSALQSWSLAADVVACLAYRRDYHDETEDSRFNRETIWIRQSQVAIEAERGNIERDLEQIAKHLTREFRKGSGHRPAAVIDMDRHDLTNDKCAFAIALAMRNERQPTILPFIIGIRTARIDLSGYAAVFSRA